MPLGTIAPIAVIASEPIAKPALGQDPSLAPQASSAALIMPSGLSPAAFLVSRLLAKPFLGQDPGLSDVFLAATTIGQAQLGIATADLTVELPQAIDDRQAATEVAKPGVIPGDDVSAVSTPTGPESASGDVASEPQRAKAVQPSIGETTRPGLGPDPGGVSAVPGTPVPQATPGAVSGPRLDEAVDLDNPVIAELIERICSPSLADQVANGDRAVVLGGELLEATEKTVNGVTVTSLKFRQQVADASEFQLNNIMAMIAKSNQRQQLDVSEVVIATISEVFNLTQQDSESLYSSARIYNSLYGARIVDIDITSGEINNTSSGEEGVLSTNFDFENKNIDGIINLNTILQVQQTQTVDTKLSYLQIDYNYGDIKFDYHAKAHSDADFRASTTVNSVIGEDITTTTTQSLQATGTAAVAGEALVQGETATSFQEMIDLDQRVYVADRDVLSQIADGRLTEEEKSALNARLQSDSAWRLNEREWESATPDAAIDVGGVRGLLGLESPSTVLTDSLRANLGEILERVKEGTISPEDAKEVTERIFAARPVGPRLHQPTSMFGQHVDTWQDPVRVEESVRVEDVNLGLDKRFEDTTTTSTEHEVTTTVTAQEFNTSISSRGEGVFAGLDFSSPVRLRDAYVFVGRQDMTHQQQSTSTKIERTVGDLSIGLLIGSANETSATLHRVMSQDTATIFHITDADVDLNYLVKDGLFTANDITFSKAVTIHQDQSELLDSKFVDESAYKQEFSEGLANLIPLAGIGINLASKSTYGQEISITDIGLAAADLAVTIATLGVGPTVGKGAVLGGKALLKGQFSKAARIAGRTGQKVATQVGRSVVDDITAPISAARALGGGAKAAGSYISRHGIRKAIRTGYDQVKVRGKMAYNVFSGKNAFGMDELITGANRAERRQGISPSGRKVRNHRLAGQHLSADDLFEDEALRIKYRNGVRYDDMANPDLTEYAVAKVRNDNLTGYAAKDSAAAYKQAAEQLQKQFPGMSEADIRKNFVWHHQPNGRDMILVPKDIHAAVPHNGSASMLRLQTKIVDGMKDTAGQIGRIGVRGATIAINENSSDNE